LKTIILITLLIVYNSVFSQENHTREEHHETKHAIAIVLSHSSISKGIQNGKTKWQSFPSWGINYNYTINDKWLLGWHNDIIIEDFVVEEHLSNNSNQILERSYPIATLIMATYKFKKHFSFLAGGGGEFAHQGNFGMVRLGVEAPFHIPNNFEIFANFTYDIKINAYDTWNLGFGVAKLF